MSNAKKQTFEPKYKCVYFGCQVKVAFEIFNQSRTTGEMWLFFFSIALCIIHEMNTVRESNWIIFITNFIKNLHQEIEICN